MASIRKRRQHRADGRLGPERWRVRWYDPDGYQQHETFDREDNALRFKARVESDLFAGSYIDPARARKTVASFHEEWRESVVDLRKSSLARLDATVSTHVLPEFGRLPLSGVSNAHVRAWVARLRVQGRWLVRWADEAGVDRRQVLGSRVAAEQLRKKVSDQLEEAGLSASSVRIEEVGLSASSVRKAVFALRRIMAAAVADRRLGVNPAVDVPLPAEEYGDQRFLDPAEVATLVAAFAPLGEGRMAVLPLVGAYGGLRFGELAALRRGRVDVLRGSVQVVEKLEDVNGVLTFGPPKTKNGHREVPLPRRIVRALEAHMDAFVAPDPGALVFTGLKGQPLRRAGFRRSWWQPAVRAAGLEPLTFHELRHTFVSLWVALNVNPKEISVRAGHSSVAFTLDRYGHLYERSDDSVSDRLDALLGDAVAAVSAPVVDLKRTGKD